MVKIFVEGGGNKTSDQRAFRRGFSKFIERANFTGRMPQFIPCGGRDLAYREFEYAIQNNQRAFLLVDSETPIKEEHQSAPWQHLAQRDGDTHWKNPVPSGDIECHFMVVVMESWFLADRAALSQFYGNGFKENKLPPEDRKIETLCKDEIYKALKNATKGTTKGEYDKGKHSFQLLEKIDPQKVIEKSPWAKRFIECLRDEMRA